MARRCSTRRRTRRSWPSTSPRGASGFSIGQSRVAVDTRIEGRERTNQGSPFAVTPDGRFVVSTAADTVVPITVVLNWQALLEK